MNRHAVASIAMALIMACSGPDDPSGTVGLVLVQAPDLVTPGNGAIGPLIVRVVNGDGESVAGVPITWSVRSGGGSIAASVDTSGVDGLATAQWTPGLATGAQQVAVTMYDEPALVISIAATAFRADKIAAALRDGCGLAGTSVWCWRYVNGYEAASTIGRILPQLHLTDLAVTSGYVCALDAGGATYCHLFSDSEPESYVVPAGLPPIRGISAGGSLFCGIAISDGTPWCWSHGNLNAYQVSSTLQLASISAGSTSRACGLTAGGAAWCWNQFPTPVEVPGEHSFQEISGRGDAMCAIEKPAALYCWHHPGDLPVAKVGVAPTQVAVGSLDENLLNVSGGPVMFYLYAGNDFVVEPSSVLPIPTRQMSDHCVLAYDGTVYCASRYRGPETPPFTWSAVPAPSAGGESS